MTATTGELPTLTVVVVCRNSAMTLAETLESVAAQEYPGWWEVLVVDNGSTDGTAVVAGRFAARLPGFRVLRPEDPGHQARGLLRIRKRHAELAGERVRHRRAADDHRRVTGAVDDRDSFLVRVMNRSRVRIGSLGDEAWVLGYRVPGLGTHGSIEVPRRTTRLTQDLFRGTTFHVVNIGAEWPGISRRSYRCCADLWSPRVGWLGGGVEVEVNLDLLGPRYSATPAEGIEFCSRGLSRLSPLGRGPIKCGAHAGTLVG